MQHRNSFERYIFLKVATSDSPIPLVEIRNPSFNYRFQNSCVTGTKKIHANIFLASPLTTSPFGKQYFAQRS